MARDIRFDRHMSDTESLMWALEADPMLRSAFGNLTFLDRPVDFERFRARMAATAAAVPRLRERVAEVAGGLAAPNWVEDTFFDIDFHVRRVAVPTPGTDRQVLDLAAVLASDPLDRSRPLWQFTLVEGLEGGRGAMLQKLHHAITDGEGGVRLSSHFLDLDRDAVPPPIEAAALPPPTRPAPRSMADAALGAAADALRRPLDLARRAVEGTLQSFAHPGGVPAMAEGAIETARSLLRQAAVTEAARSPLWGNRSLRRRVEVLSIDLDDAKRAAKTLGGTVNDLFVTGAAGAAGAYHRAKGAPVDVLRMAMPISTRSGRDEASNAFTPTRTLVPTGIEDPVARFEAVRLVLATTRAERVVSVASGMAGVLAVLPTSVLVAAARQQVSTVDFTTSNVRGAPVDLYLGGAKVLSNHPLGPMAGTAFNLTTLSHAGRLDMGCVIDPAAVDDPELLRRCLVEAYRELLAAG